MVEHKLRRAPQIQHLQVARSEIRIRILLTLRDFQERGAKCS
jgi:hypothetical protein